MRITFAFVSILFAISTSGQEATVGAPVEVLTDLTFSKEPPSLYINTLTVKNVAAKPIMGFVVKMEFLSQSGKVAKSQVHTLVKGDMAIAGRINYIYPNEKVKLRGAGAPTDELGSPLPHRIVVDSVVFADGSSWGPIVRPESLRMIGWTEGIRMHRMRVKDALAKHGVTGVMQQLDAK